MAKGSLGQGKGAEQQPGGEPGLDWPRGPFNCQPLDSPGVGEATCLHPSPAPHFSPPTLLGKGPECPSSPHLGGRRCVSLIKEYKGEVSWFLSIALIHI